MTSSTTFCRLSVDDTVRKLQTSATDGLDGQDALYRRRIHGMNTLEVDDDENLILKFISQFYEDPLILMLIASAVISLCLGNFEDAISIAMALFFVVSVGFVQEYRSEQSLKALNNLVPPSAHVVRNGTAKTMLASGLVPGDLVSFTVGDRIPADVRIIKANHLAIDESSLTGENRPVEKTAVEISHNHISHGIVPISDRSCIGFMGTLVTGGNGTGLVVGINRDTEFGSIFHMMAEIDKPKTPLQNAMTLLGKQLSMVSFAVIGVICVIGLLQGRSLLEMFQIGVSLAVAAIPEGLPIIVTVTLALGVLRMAKKNAIVRRLPSVETLGSVDVICSDKTGTLTQNKLTVTGLYAPCTNSWVNTIHNSQVMASPDLKRLLLVGNLCNDAILTTSTSELTSKVGASVNLDEPKFSGSPVDIALLNVLDVFGESDARSVFERVDELPFSSSRKFMCTIARNSLGEFSMSVKGAMERLIPFCTHYTAADGTELPLTDDVVKDIEAHVVEQASKGLRILAFAYSHASSSPAAFVKEAPQNLVFAGLAAMSDPPRAGVHGAVLKLRESGVKIIVITGDNEITAIAAARSIGIPIPHDHSQYVISGPTLEAMKPEQLAAAIDRVLVFARTSPEMKVKIVNSLQMRGHIVAMTGDGVNDAPALKLADIGVAMGSGTDVAKEAGDMILVDDDFSTILEAIREGKAIFANVKSFLSFQLSTSVAALSLVVVSTLFGLPNPLNAMQILWINVLMDGPPAQSLGTEPVDPEVMSKPPRKRGEAVLTSKVIRRVFIRGTMILVGTMFVYMREMSDKIVTARDTTMSFTCFVFFDLFNAVASRSATRSVFELGLFSNKMFNLAVGCSFVCQLGVIYLPFLQSVFQTEAISFGDLLFLLVVSSSILWVDEFLKYQRRQSQHHADYSSGMV